MPRTDSPWTPATHRCPDNGATVDLETCAISADLGAAQLGATWTDPTWDAPAIAFYYARVLENPTCRWSTWGRDQGGRGATAGVAGNAAGTGLDLAGVGCARRGRARPWARPLPYKSVTALSLAELTSRAYFASTPLRA